MSYVDSSSTLIECRHQNLIALSNDDVGSWQSALRAYMSDASESGWAHWLKRTVRSCVGGVKHIDSPCRGLFGHCKLVQLKLPRSYILSVARQAN